MMDLILANLPPPTGDQLLTWLSCLCGLLGLIVLAKKAFGKEAVPPQPFVVQGNTRYATHEELEKLEERVERSSKELREDIKELATLSAVGRKNIYAKMDDVLKTVSRMEGKLEEISK